MNKRQVEEKTYEQYMEDAVKKISLYDPEWTNYNPSDPGITILENITAMNMLQQNYMSTEHNEEKESLLKLVGFTARKGKKAYVDLVADNVKQTIIIPENQQFKVGDLPFECEKATLISKGRIIDILVGDKSYMQLLQFENRFPMQIFTEKPEKGMEMIILFDEFPEDNDKIRIYVNTFCKYDRNPAQRQQDMALMRWQLYTNAGFKDICVEDETQCFLFDGVLNLKIGSLEPKVWNKDNHRGYAVRGILEKAEYDIAPQLIHVAGPLFRISQQETKAFAKEFEDTADIAVYSDILESEYTRIYVCQEDEKSYHLCDEAWYQVEHEGYGMFHYVFKCTFKKILLVSYEREMMHLCKIGNIYGYDDEWLELPIKNSIISKCSLLLECENANGEKEYHYMKQDKENAGGFRYTVDNRKDRISILDCGCFSGCTVYIGMFIVSKGKKGNVPAGKRFIPVGYDEDIRFYNPAHGCGGCDYENIDELEKRYLIDVNESYSAVLPKDYNRIVKNTPALCIDKVNTYGMKGDDIIHIAVKPFSEKKHPLLSKNYRKSILSNLEEYRILNTRIKLEAPVYTAVNVYAKMSVKEHYADAQKIICRKLEKIIDFTGNDRNFGEILRFDVVFKELDRLECVENIGELSLRPAGLSHVRMEGVDIIPDGNCLLYQGDIRIDII